MAGMDDFLRALPKAELHVHLEGSVEPETLLEINSSLSLDEIRNRYVYSDFRGFLDSYKWVSGHLRSARDYALITRRLIERLRREGVVHVEINISAGVILWKNQRFEEMFEAAAGEAARAEIPVLFIFDAVRQFGLEAAWAVAKQAVRFRHQGVVAFGIGGDEKLAPAPLFREIFDYAKSEGLRIVPHAGETGGAASVREAIECGADRIGHGIAAASDPALMETLRERDIPLEVCVSSNLRTGVVQSIEDHPLRKLWDARVPIVLNSDDPPMFQTTLLGEYRIAAERFGFDRDMLRQAAANSLRYRFRSTPAD